MSACICRTLTELVCSTDQEEESRIRRLPGGIQIECWRRIAKIVVPDDLPPGPNDVDIIGVTPGLTDAESPGKPLPSTTRADQ